MNITRTISLIRSQNIGKTLTRNLRFSAVNHESSHSTQPQVKEEKFDFEDLKVLQRVERRKAKIPPFLKNIFVSVFNRELLAYPEILNKEESEALEARLSALEKVFSDPEKTREDRREALKKTNLYAAHVNLTNGGLAANTTESLRYLETISSDLQLGKELAEHWIGLEALKHGLGVDEYQKLIGDLITGDKTISLCIKEKVADRISQADFRTSAELDGKGVWRITGEKACQHPNGYYLVLSSVEASRLMAYLVHPGAEGVRHENGFVSFLQTPGIPLELMSEQQLAQTLGVSRLYSAALCRCCLSQAIKSCSEFVHSKAFAGKSLAELQTVKQTFGQALLHIYASESAEYFAASLVDGYTEPDAELELAACRYFISSHGLSSLLKLLAIPALEMPEETGRHLDEMRELVLGGETLDSISLFIALNGVHHAGKMMAEEVKQIRNPLFHPTFIIKKVIESRHQEKDDPKLTLYLAEDLHPSLKQPAEQLEYCVMRMKFATETMLSRHGLNVQVAYTELNRLAEAASEILTMTAVLARASRAYCIGLKNAEVEMKLAACFVEQSKDRVRKLIKEIDDGEFLNLDHFTIHFGKKMLDTKSSLVEHPTARVFW